MASARSFGRSGEADTIYSVRSFVRTLRRGGRDQSRPYNSVKLHGAIAAVILSAAKNLSWRRADSSLRSE